MRFISIACRVPAVERKGDQVVAFQHLSYLVERGHFVDIICFGNEANCDENNAKLKLESLGINVHFVKWSLVEATINVLFAFFSTMPLQCALFKSKRFFDKFEEILGQKDINAVHCVLARAVVNAKGYSGPLYVDLIDSMYLNFWRRSASKAGFLGWLLKIETSRVKKFEFSLAERSKKAFVVSEVDRATIASTHVEAIPIGVDFSRFSGNREIPLHPVIVFTGNMNYGPNIEAILWFVKNCWPEVKRQQNYATLVIAGSNPSKKIRNLTLACSAITVTGRVPSIAEIYLKSTLAIAPMQSGSGMQFKLLEAMACSIPVVTTNIGLEGIEAIPGREILIADNPQLFVKHVLSLIDSRDLNLNVGGKGQAFVTLNHDWRSINQKFYSRLFS
jgi:glycosyltransferase involved in cell wall biosynthesis